MIKMTTEVPVKNAVIGFKEIVNNIKSGKIKKVILANNCPDNLIKEIEKLKVNILKFEGDQQQLGTKLGRPFPVTMVGYPE